MKSKVNSAVKYLNWILFAIIGIATTCLQSNLFTDTHILPQWYAFAGISLVWSVIYFLKRKSIEIKLSLFSLALTAFLLYVFAHSLFAENLNINILTIPCLILLFIIFQSSEDKDFEVFRKIIVGVALIQAVYGLLQYAHVFPNHTSFPIVGTFDNPAGFAVCIVASLPFCLLSLNIKKLWGILCTVSAVVMLIALVLSESRAGILCVIIILLVYGYFKLVKSISRTKAILGVILVAGVALLLSFGFKQDSAIGRLLIWNNTIEMFKDAPLLGYGANTFQADYMTYQANFFEENPAHPHSDLADNVIHPFNEYLLLLSEHGIVGALLLLSVLVILIWKQKQVTPFLLTLIGIGCFALFSYPLKYTYVLIIVALCCAYIAREMNLLSVFRLSKAGRFIAAGLSIVMIYFLCVDISFEYRWRRAVSESMHTMNHALGSYAKLYETWNGNPLFLYNYGAYLNQQKHYDESNTVLQKCERYFNDYDVQLSIANNYFYTHDWVAAESRYKYAALMCPNRFVPLYQLFNIYLDNNDIDAARKIGSQILAKPVKIESTTVSRIKSEVSKIMDSRFSERDK